MLNKLLYIETATISNKMGGVTHVASLFFLFLFGIQFYTRDELRGDQIQVEFLIDPLITRRISITFGISLWRRNPDLLKSGIKSEATP